MALALVAGADDASSLEDRIAAAMGAVNAATAGLVALLAEALRTDAWQVEGIRSPEHWVTWQCGVSSRRAATLVATARGLDDLPSCRSLFERGELTEDQAGVVARGVDAAHDDEMASLAPLWTVNQLRRAVRSLPVAAADAQAAADADDGDDGESDGHDDARPRRELAFGYRDDGWFWCRALLPPDEGARFELALARARDAELRLRHPDLAPDGDASAPAPPIDRPTAADLSWADGLMRLTDAALNNLDPGDGRPGDRWQAYLHVRADAPFSSYLHLGPRVSDAVRREILCDAPIRFVFERDGRIVALSEKQETVDTKTRRLIEHRDGGCRVPGCGQRRWLHVHHIVHREDGGATTLDNLCCLCPTHHRMHHQGALQIRGDPTTIDGLEVVTRGGRRLGPRRPVRPRPRPPGAPPRGAAPYRHPLGERTDWRWLSWG